MIILEEGLHAAKIGGILIISDAPIEARPLHPQALVLASSIEALAATTVALRRFLEKHELDEIAGAMKISRSSAHRLRRALGISKRGPYEK